MMAQITQGRCTFNEEGILRQCVCGNTVEENIEPEFYYCDSEGKEVKNAEFEEVMSAYHMFYCKQCGRIIDEESQTVIGFKKNPGEPTR